MKPALLCYLSINTILNNFGKTKHTHMTLINEGKVYNILSKMRALVRCSHDEAAFRFVEIMDSRGS